MSIAAQRVLASMDSNKIRKQVTDTELKAAYDTYIADISSREEVKARHILVAEKQIAEDIISQLKGGLISSRWLKKINRTKGQMAVI